MSELKEKITCIREKLLEASGGRDVFLLPVTKTITVDVINALWEIGIRDIGENRVQEYVTKRPYFQENFQLHFIGQLQTNKVRGIIEDVYLIQSVDRLSLAREIQRLAVRHGRTVDILVQVNIAGEAQKAGIAPDGLDRLLDAIAGLPNLRLRGLMTIAPYFDNPELARPVFAKARALFEGIHGIPGVDILSMGMSQDSYVAVQEGSTMVRVGSALFGYRAQ